MLIRFIVNNVYSFGKQTEFNMLPNARYKTLEHHKYNACGIELLKMTSLYGANAAGKSNFVKAIQLLQNIVIDGKLPFEINEHKFKLSDSTNEPILFAIEFIHENIPFYYALQIYNEIIQQEELYISGVGKKMDKLVFERKTNQLEQTKIVFEKSFYNNQKNIVMAELIEESICKPNEPILKLLTTLNNTNFEKAKLAFAWFKKRLQIIQPETKIMALAHLIDHDESFKNFTQSMLCSFDVGIKSIDSAKQDFEDFTKDMDDDKKNQILNKLKEFPSMVGLRQKGKEFVVAKENDKIYVKQLKLGHGDKDDIKFDLTEESDGTIRLLDLIPAFRAIVEDYNVYVIDEIERSIHPLLMKKMIEKFSLDEQTKGQLVFTTHESNLLDQSIFRKDEIWFAEKDKNGSTDLYSLSDYKEHNTIDIRKGYLNGRYGSIPFLANLEDLNWH